MSRNDITGDKIATKPASDEFRAAFDRIFGAPRRIPVCVRQCPIETEYGPATCGVCAEKMEREG